jgi:hypothetical protein
MVLPSALITVRELGIRSGSKQQEIPFKKQHPHDLHWHFFKIHTRKTPLTKSYLESTTTRIIEVHK